MRPLLPVLARIGDFGLFAPPVLFLAGILLPPLALMGQAVLVPCVIVLLAMKIGRAHV